MATTVRYIVNDVPEAIRFYLQLGFALEMNPAPGFAMLARDELRLMLNVPGAGGAGQSTPDGQTPSPGGWNRFQLSVDDVSAMVRDLQGKGMRFKSPVIQGQGGKQALLEDPSGNLIELFEANPTGKARPIPDGFHSVTPFLLAERVEDFIAFVRSAFSGEVQHAMKSADGVVRHATIKIGDSIVMVSSGTEIYGSMPCMLHLYVKDVDAQFAQAKNAGGKVLRAPTDEFYGDRTAAIEDAWRNQWWMATHIEDVPPEELQKREAEFRQRVQNAGHSNQSVPR